MSQMDIQALIDEFGARYEDNGQLAKDIRAQLFAQDDIMVDFKKKPHTNSEYKGVSTQVGSVLQGFLKKFADKGDAQFLVWKQKMGEFKIDKALSPDDFRNTYLGFLADLPEPDRTKWPIIGWMINNLLVPKAKEDFVHEVAYWGWQFTATHSVESVNTSTFERTILSTPGTPLKANTSMDGIRIQIAKMAAANRCVTITTGAWDSDPEDFVTQIESFVKEIPVALAQQIDYLYMSLDLEGRYRDGIRAKYNKYYAQESELNGIKDTRIKVKGTITMTGSQKVWGTTKANRVFPVRADMSGKFDVQKDKRDVAFLNDWSYLLTFDVPQFVVTSEHENTIASEETDPGGRYDSGIEGGLGS